MIRITYVTITYNAAKVLQRTLDSVLEQDYHDIVHLIIDGASTDDTLKIVDDYIARSNAAENGHRIQVMSEPDKGIYVETLTSSLSPHSSQLPAVLYGDTDIVDGEGRFLYHRRLAPPENLTWKSFRQGMLVCHQAFYARTDFAIATPYDMQYRYSADVDWCIRVMKAADKEKVPMLNLKRVVANYTQEGQTTLHHRESLIERYRVMAHHYGHVQTFLMHLWFVVRALFKK